MKRLLPIILCFCFCVVLLSGCGSNQGDLDDAWDAGYDAGYDVGFEECIALYEAFEEYDDTGYEDGYDNGYSDGYDDGHSDGYYAGATYTCLFFGDVERAFKCAKNGSAWYALIDAYDQYEYDIYDDDDKEARSELFWALVSYASKDGATKEERKLLYSAFGSDLYYLDE